MKRENTKEYRAFAKVGRAMAREQRDKKRASNQKKADAQTYGKDSLTYKMTYGEEGKVQDVSTTETSQYTENKTDYESDSNQRGTDNFSPRYDVVDIGTGGSGLPDFPSDPAPEQVDIGGVLIWEEGNFDEARWCQCSANDFQAVKSDNTVDDFVFLTLSNLAP